MMSAIWHKFVLGVKRFIYWKCGEPYVIAGRTLRYRPGTRPVRTSYVNSTNDNSRYDALQIQLLAEHLREGDTAIDIGAHAGQYCILMAAMCGATGNVVAFEPDPHARKMLMRNLELNPTIKRPTVEALAVSDARGEAVLYSRGGNSLSSLARSGIGEAAAQDVETIVVPLVTLRCISGAERRAGSALDQNRHRGRRDPYIEGRNKAPCRRHRHCLRTASLRLEGIRQQLCGADGAGRGFGPTHALYRPGCRGRRRR